jgi:type IV fimbrial biogenesis protein FimT
MLMRCIKYKELGLTLVELLVTIAVIGVLATLAIPSYTAWIQNSRIRTAAESIQTGIQMARAEAVSRNASVQLDFRGTNSAWTVCASPVAPGACPNPDDATTIQSRAASEGSSADINIVTSDNGPFVFNSFGVMTSPVPATADGLVSIDVDVDTSVLSASESRELRLIIGVGGSVRMCDPALDTVGTDPRKCPV